MGCNFKDILIDGKHKDIKQPLTRPYKYVSQEPVLFNDTFANNIAFGVENATSEQITKAATVAHAHDFIIESASAYQTKVGDLGQKLSGGQRQRVSIARAVLKNPPLLILDEATSSLDTESEKLVQEALQSLMKNRTSIIIAHRLSTIKCGSYCCIPKGEVVEQGTHDELSRKRGNITTCKNSKLQETGYYRNLWFHRKK